MVLIREQKKWQSYKESTEGAARTSRRAAMATSRKRVILFLPVKNAPQKEKKFVGKFYLPYKFLLFARITNMVLIKGKKKALRRFMTEIRRKT